MGRVLGVTDGSLGVGAKSQGLCTYHIQLNLCLHMVTKYCRDLLPQICTSNPTERGGDASSSSSSAGARQVGVAAPAPGESAPNKGEDDG